jgi:hypothetical protein
VVPIFIGELVCESPGERLKSLFDSDILESLSRKVHGRVNRKAEAILGGLNIGATKTLHSRSVKDVVDVIMSHKAILAEEKFVPLCSSQTGANHGRESCMRSLVKSLAKELMAISAREWSKKAEGVKPTKTKFMLQRAATIPTLDCVKTPNRGVFTEHERESNELQRHVSATVLPGCIALSEEEDSVSGTCSADDLQATSRSSVTGAEPEMAMHICADEISEMSAKMHSHAAQKDAEIADLRAAFEKIQLEKDEHIRNLQTQLTMERAIAEQTGARLAKVESELAKLRAALSFQASRPKDFYALVARETVILSEFAAGTGAPAFVPKSYFCFGFLVLNIWCSRLFVNHSFP